MVYASTIPLGIGTNYQVETQATTLGIYRFEQHGYKRINFFVLVNIAKELTQWKKEGILGIVLVVKYMMRNKAQMEADNTGLNNTTISQFLVKGNCNEAMIRQWVPPLLVPKF
ncbi:hypothetical protein H5410_061936 [Solanum commersonii]|uniref:Uncharacterized protein n=1 Tax=Solanum commersonii TaxID=4109 RepID=A0A9J5W9E2_SOLCO|nr:hypothetical protein H5410_061936 [Solanum commersonii]